MASHFTDLYNFSETVHHKKVAKDKFIRSEVKVTNMKIRSLG
jgi:hypothetical protein